MSSEPPASPEYCQGVNVGARDDDVRRWTLSGCRALSGSPERSGSGPPQGFVAAVDAVAQRIGLASEACGNGVTVDALAEIGLRARLVGFRRRGAISCGGASRLLPSADGVVAVTLARTSDVAVIPALLGRSIDIDGDDLPPSDRVWAMLSDGVKEHSSEELVSRARLLGLPLSAVSSTPPLAPGARQPIDVTRYDRGPGRRVPASPRLRVLDLSSLWAGPLCSQVLTRMGADVVKVESTRRPDGARDGSPAVWHHLHQGQRSAAFDMETAAGRARLAELMSAADVVIEASRPRALAAWGLSPTEVMGPSVWVSITGYGYRGRQADRVGFGDDVAAGAGLVVDHPGGPWFCADAVADPLTGLTAAALVLEAVGGGERTHVDVSMHEVARQFAGHVAPCDADVVADPFAAPSTETLDAPATEVVLPLGAHTHEVLREWCP